MAQQETKNLKDNLKKHGAASGWAHLVGGGLGGLVGAVATSPLDVLKTRMQSSLFRSVSTSSSVAAVGRALGQMAREEGITSWWKGITANLVAVVPARAIYFFSYAQGKQLLGKTLYQHDPNSSAVHLLAAANAGIIVGTVTCPIWVVKTRMQLQSSLEGAQLSMPKYRNSLHCFFSLLRNEGFRALYKGLGASYLGVSESTLQFVVYERLKAKYLPIVLGHDGHPRHSQRHPLRSSSGKDRPTAGPHLSSASVDSILAVDGEIGGEPLHEPDGEEDYTRKSTTSGLSFLDNFFSLDWREPVALFTIAGIAKLFAAVLTYPHEVVRTRMREPTSIGEKARYVTIPTTIRLIVKEEGLSSLYSGMGPHLLRVVPNAAIMFGCYEFVVKMASPATATNS